MAKYALGVSRDFPARHYLVGGDFGPEGELHAHHYRVEVVLEGERLDEHGFLLDITRVKAELDRVVEHYRERVLNDLPEFAGMNPGCEAFAEVLAVELDRALDREDVSALTVKLWEDESAWASCRRDRQSPAEAREGRRL